MKLVASERFNRELEGILKKNYSYNPRVKRTLARLLSNPQHPSLRLHKVSGTRNYSISVDMRIRIIFRHEEESYYLLRIGTHELVY